MSFGTSGELYCQPMYLVLVVLGFGIYRRMVLLEPPKMEKRRKDYLFKKILMIVT